ncbi:MULTISPECIES: IclR family transcriptional regulator [unclassified Bradyrhizobium]|uniref:IclR family transcriptional regulator n=1 Tax=unclassified Bradyrhizobium TaxID=2631580 RepID=UPI002305CF46|nr:MULTISPECIES: IclR family transcriptional regulator [unclassified Bradyrhizobium]MDA9451208.1 hypothetical protein [Bradyrhizobium sp. CCBAU 21360]MDA9457587.1 hypothetical protein [Bradyrhizobium sp. CCBAU 21359]
MPEKERNQSVGKAAAILRTFTHDCPELSLTEVVQRTGYPRTVCYRMLVSLQQEGFVDKNEQTSRYRLGLDLFKLGSAAIAGIDLRSAALPPMRALSEATKNTVLLVVEHNLQAICIDKVDGDLPIQANVMSIGTTLPLHCGGAPFIILANLPHERQEMVLAAPLVKRTQATNIDPKAIRIRMALDKARGFAIGEEDVADLVVAVGAPIFGPGGRLEGAISVGGLKHTYTHERLQEVAKQAVHAARAISSKLGA